MNKKTYTIIGIVVLLFVGAGGAVLATHHNHKATPKMASCVMKDDSSALKVPTDEVNNIGIAASNYITNVPAGTNTTVNVKSYDGDKTAGSVIYDGSYGSYNFTATKEKNVPASSQYINWKVTSFVVCKRS